MTRPDTIVIKKLLLPACILFGVMLSGCTPKLSMAPKVPDSLKVPDSQQLIFALRGIGIQVYECRSVQSAPHGYAWVFLRPSATLFDRNGNVIGKHYSGPTWEARDGSKVVAQVVTQKEGEASDAVPWLLLRVKEASGQGIFNLISSIQRLNTVGGEAPQHGCSRPEQAGKEIHIPYRADYYFYASKI